MSNGPLLTNNSSLCVIFLLNSGFARGLAFGQERPPQLLNSASQQQMSMKTTLLQAKHQLNAQNVMQQEQIMQQEQQNTGQRGPDIPCFLKIEKWIITKIRVSSGKTNV